MHRLLLGVSCLVIQAGASNNNSGEVFRPIPPSISKWKGFSSDRSKSGDKKKLKHPGQQHESYFDHMPVDNKCVIYFTNNGDNKMVINDVGLGKNRPQSMFSTLPTSVSPAKPSGDFLSQFHSIFDSRATGGFAGM